MMHSFFRQLPGFETDDDAPLALAAHEAALAAFEKYACGRNPKLKTTCQALLFDFALLDQSIRAADQTYDIEEHAHVAVLSEQMKNAESQLASFGFEPIDVDIRVRSYMRCG
jgi:hypothetical protein